MKKTTVSLLLAAAVGAGIVFFTRTERLPHEKQAAVHAASSKPHFFPSVSINYETEASAPESKVDTLNEAASFTDAETTLRHESGRVQTTDVSGRHRIAIEGLASVKKNASAPVYILEGKVDGSAFRLKIPQASLKGTSGTLVFVVTDLKSGTMQRTPFIYGSDLKDTSKRHVLDYYTDQPDNYEFTSARLLLPGENAD